MKKVLLGVCCLSLVLSFSAEGFGATKKKRKTTHRRTHHAQESASPAAVAPTPVADAAVPPPPPPSGWYDKMEVTWKKGLVFKTKDEKFSSKFSIRLQPRYEFTEKDDAANDTTFRIRRAKVAWEGNAFTKNLKYKVQIVPTVSKMDEFLEDAWVDYRFKDQIKLEIGQYKIPFNRQQMTSSGRQQLVDRSLASDEFRFSSIDRTTKKTCTLSTGETVTGTGVTCGGGATSTTTNTDADRKFQYDLGLMLHGDLFENKLEYDVSVTNGSGFNRLNGSNEFLYAGRLAWNALGQYGYSESDVDNTEHPALVLGASGAYNVQDYTDTKVTMAGADLGFKYKGISLQGEYFMRNKDTVGTSDNTRDHGYYAQAGYFIIPNHFEIVGRASQIAFAGTNNNKSEFSAGLNYFFFGHNLKLQGDYSYLPTQSSSGKVNDQRARLQLQTWF